MWNPFRSSKAKEEKEIPLDEQVRRLQGRLNLATTTIYEISGILSLEEYRGRWSQKYHQLDQCRKYGKTGELSKILITHAEDLSHLIRGLEDDKSNMKRQYASNISNLTAELAQSQKQHQREVNSLQETSRATEQELQFQMREMSKKHKAEESNMKRRHERELKRLRDDIEAYSAALMTRDEKTARVVRDDFKQLPDEEIASKFSELVQAVDRLARLDWTTDQWVAERISHVRPMELSLTKLKQCILQETIWVTLHEYIFCSPFRIFGKEGHKLEEEWNKECGQDSEVETGAYQWPPPTVKCERWRYVTIKECRAALTPPLPSELDARHNLTKGFQESIAALRADIASVLGGVVGWNRSSFQAMERMTLAAANMWLEFGMQRCRILVVLQGTRLKSVEQKIKMVQSDDMTFEVVPALIRYGDSKGLDLQDHTTIGNFKGEMIGTSH